MIAWAYYNEFDPEAAAWLQNNIDAGLIAPGCVDTRSIADVQPEDLDGFVQCHFFAGIGGWSYAARLAGWPDERPLWSGSCPCQPFSAAGKGLGTDDPRHLWPHLHRLIRARRPTVTVGEQVAGAAGYGWFDGVRADLAREGFAGRTVDIPALAVDAPHQRNRLYWVALADAEGSGGGAGLREDGSVGNGLEPSDCHGGCSACGGSGRMGPFFPGGMSTICGNCQGSALVDAARLGRGKGRAEHELRRGRDAASGSDAPGVTQGDALGAGLEGQRGHGDGGCGWPQPCRPVAEADGGGAGHMAHANVTVVQGQPSTGQLRVDEQDARVDYGRNGSWWAGADWILCHDQKARRVADARAPLLVDGFPNRILAWGGLGNAIVPPLAGEVIGALSDTLPPWSLAA